MLSTSVSLLDRAKKVDDRDAWNRIVELYSPLLLKWCRLTGVPHAEVHDIVQEIFVVLLREIPDFEYDSQKGSFRNWLKTIATNKCREYFRRRAAKENRERAVAVNQETEFDDSIEKFWEQEYEALLWRSAIQIMKTEFEESTWQACWEFIVSGRSAKEIGQELNMSEGAVYVAKSRVLKKIREQLKGMLE